MTTQIKTPDITDDAVTEDKIPSSATGTGIAGGSGSVLELDTAVTVTYAGADVNFPADELKAGTPTIDGAAANKKYVDDEVDTVLALPAVGQSYPFNGTIRVPAPGTLYLDYGQAITSSVAVAVPVAFTLVGASVVVNAADPTRSYTLDVLINGAVTDTLPLAATNTEAYISSWSTALVAGDNIALRLVKTAGPAGPSTFATTAVTLLLGV